MAPPEVVSMKPCPLVPVFKERPILFSAPMVRALLDGSKTQTRRVVKPRDLAWMDEHQGLREPDNAIRCPYGQPGDRLWVRETFSGPYCMERTDEFPALPPGQWPPECPIWYWANGEPTHGDWTRPRPSIHMPRSASRIDLEVTGVRVERLQDISEADAKAEGIVPHEVRQMWLYGATAEQRADTYRRAAVDPYRELWDSLNAAGRPVLPANPASQRFARVKAWLDKHPDTTSWAANPWVWVVGFRRIRP